MHPAVFIDDLRGGLFILVITHHHVLAAEDYFPYLLLRVGGIDGDLQGVDRSSRCSQLRGIPGGIADKRSALGHSIPNCELKADFFEKPFGFRVEGSATDYYFHETSAESLGKFLIDLPVKDSVYSGNCKEYLHVRLRYDREKLFLEDLFYHQWN